MFLVTVSYTRKTFFGISQKETLHAHYWAKDIDERVLVITRLRSRGIHGFRVYKARES